MTMEQPDHDGSLARMERRARELFDERVASLDPRIAMRLGAARRVALSELEARAARPFRIPGVWLPAGVLAASAVLAVAVWIARPSPTALVATDASALEEVEVLAAADEPELYNEDPDFYEWAANGDDRGI
jgi:hypothetical protein